MNKKGLKDTVKEHFIASVIGIPATIIGAIMIAFIIQDARFAPIAPQEQARSTVEPTPEEGNIQTPIPAETRPQIDETPTKSPEIETTNPPTSLPLKTETPVATLSSIVTIFDTQLLETEPELLFDFGLPNFLEQIDEKSAAMLSANPDGEFLEGYYLDNMISNGLVTSYHASHENIISGSCQLPSYIAVIVYLFETEDGASSIFSIFKDGFLYDGLIDDENVVDIRNIARIGDETILKHTQETEGLVNKTTTHTLMLGMLRDYSISFIQIGVIAESSNSENADECIDDRIATITSFSEKLDVNITTFIQP